MKIVPITLAALLCVFACTAQQSKRYILLNNGDSIAGNIVLTKQGVQVSDQHNKVVGFTTDEVKQIKIGDKAGRLYAGVMFYYNDAIDSDVVGKVNTDTVLIATPIFTSPTFTLYEAVDQLKKIQYLISGPGDTKLTHLAVGYSITASKSLSTHPQYDKKFQVELKYFTNQLRTLFNNCSKFSDDYYSSMTYRSYSFIQAIRRYNKKCN